MIKYSRICGFIVAGFIASCLSAHSQAPKANSGEVIPTGLLVDVMLKTDLSSKYSKVGDPVELEVVKSAVGTHYQSLFSVHTRLRGSVTMVRKAAKGETAAVAIRVVEAQLKSGSQPINGILGTPVLIKHGWSKFTTQSNAHDYNSVANGEELSPLDGASVDQDSVFG